MSGDAGHKPHWGFTEHHQFAVHAHTADHLPANTRYQRLNKRLAQFITRNVGTMTCFWIFCVISLSSLLAVLFAAHIIGPVGFLTASGFILCVSWLSQNLIQLVLLPALMVGQNLQNAASDARTAKQFEDTELIADRLNLETQGGLTTVLDAVNNLGKEVTSNGRTKGSQG